MEPAIKSLSYTKAGADANKFAVPWLFAIIKHPMKIIFMHPKKAALCIIKGIFEDCDANEWIGPRIFDVWGFPRKGKLRGIDTAEIARVSETAEKI